MTDEERPLSSEELIRRARDAMSAPRIEQGAPTPDDRPDGSPPEEGSGNTDGVELAEPVGPYVEKSSPSRLEPDDTLPVRPAAGPGPGGHLGEPEPTGPEIDEPTAGSTPYWPPDRMETPEPQEPKPNFWVRLLVFRGWIIGGIAVVFFISRFFGGGTAISSLDVGDCFDEPSFGEEVTDVDVVGCEDLHDFETFAIVDLGAVIGGFPGDLELSDTLAEDCYRSFEAYVGIEWESSIYDFAWYYPTEDAWKSGSKDGICAVYESDPQTFEAAKRRGSVRGTVR